MESRLELNKDGTRTLIVYYQGDRYDEAIQSAEKQFGIEGDPTVTVIAKPDHNRQIELPFGTNTGID